MSERTCQLTGKAFEVSAAELAAYAHFEIPLPILSPEERFRRLTAFRPEKQFFLRTCDATGARLFSTFPEQTAFPVYSWEYWNSDSFDPLTFGQSFDFKRLFVEQLLELWRKVPRPAFVVNQSPGSRICHRSWNVSDSFLVFDSIGADHCLYSTALFDSSYCIDCYQLSQSKWCYETIASEHCERIRFSEFCSGCRDGWFLSNCTNCTDCLFCANLEGKRFHIFNQPVSEEQFRQTVRELSLDAGPLLELAKNRYRDFVVTQSAPHLLSDNPLSGTGNYHRRSTNVVHAFEISDSRQVFNSRDVHDSVLVLDGLSVWSSREIAQSVAIFNGQRLLNCSECWDNVSDLAYSSYCRSSANLLGCVGLKEKEYCIFNVQYSRAEYLALRERIVQHLKDRSIWGTPLPMSFSPHAYNHSAANEYMPLTKVPAKMMGFAWDETDQPIRPSDLIGESDSPPEDMFMEVPERIGDGFTELTRAVFLCSVTGKPFQFSLAELEAYRALGLPPPSVCFQQRYFERMARLTPHQLTSRKCSVTGKMLLTSFPAKWKQPIAELGSVPPQQK